MPRGPRPFAPFVGLLLAACATRAEKPAPTPEIAAPTLVSSSPVEGASSVPRTAWVVLDFAAPLDAKADAAFSLACGGRSIVVTLARLGDGSRVVVNPSSDLPDASPCWLSWRGATRRTGLHFSTASRGAPAHVLYDRRDGSAIAPYPDDALLVDDPKTRTGRRVHIDAPGSGPRRDLLEKAIAPSLALDGFSPIALSVVALDAPLDPSTAPHDAAESLDPLATIGLFDIDPASARRGARVPFELVVDDRPSANGASAHVLRLFPSHPLEPSHRYGLVITRRALVDPTRPLDPSGFEASVLSSGTASDPASARAASLGRAVVAEVEASASPPIHADDVALALSISTRSLDDVSRDVLAMRKIVLASAPPKLTVTAVTRGSVPSVAATVTGTFDAPLFLDADGSIARDVDGAPRQVGVEAAPFALSLPTEALAHPVPAIMLQHGHVSDAPSIVAQIGGGELAPAGLAGIGFTDIMMRRPALVSTDYVLDGLVKEGRIADYETQTWAEQLAFLRLVPALAASLDVLPLAADGTSTPDGRPDLDASAPLSFAGFSAGSFHGAGLLAYAPEIRAAVLAVGAGHWSAKTMHQRFDLDYDALAQIAPDLERADAYAFFGLAQAAFDAQDPLVHARFARRAPVLSGTGTSVLVTEGIGDTLVPAVATRGLAWQLGLPHMKRVAVAVPFLDAVAPPITANLDASATGAFLQLVPVGVDGVAPTPACAATGETVAHYCADVSKAVASARVAFFTSALGGAVPTLGPVDN